MSAQPLELLPVVDEIGRIRRRMSALSLCAIALEMEGDKRAGQGIRELVDIIDDDLRELYETLDEARGAAAVAAKADGG